MGALKMAMMLSETAVRERNIPPVDRAELSDLDIPTGIFGSQHDLSRIDANDDNHAALMSCLYPFHREG